MLFKNGVCTSTARLDGKTALVTGANTGVGKATVEDFYKRGARVIMACRNLEKVNEAINDIKNRNTNASSLGEIAVVHLDLASLGSVRQCAKEILEKEHRLDLLINNAGIMACPESKTEDGFEMQFGVNHLGHFLLTILLLPKLLQSRPARIVNVSSMAHEYKAINFDDLNFEKSSYSASGAYRQSKLCNILFTKELARRLTEAGIRDVTVYCLHPGVVKTELVRHMDRAICPGMTCLYAVFMRWWAKDEHQGAQTTIHCAVCEKAAKETGLYYIDCRVENPSRHARKMEDGKKLWDVSLKYCQLESFDPIKNYQINS